MAFRPYDPERDRDAAVRMWREVGWLPNDQPEGLDVLVSAGKGYVADIEDSPECFVIMTPGTIRHLQNDLSLTAVVSVTTSRIARKQRFASRLTAHALANAAVEGNLVSTLGMFEQGYYNRLGFGSGPYMNDICFDPADLLVNVSPRVPRRITTDDVEAVHASRLSRLRGHGAVNMLSPLMTRVETGGDKNAFGLGYYDGPTGELTHSLWINPEGGEHGPYHIKFATWQTGEQFLELMALLKSIGDQVHLVHMIEPQGIQMQDFIRQPIKKRNITKGSEYEVTIKAGAWLQLRILDLPGCMARTHLPCADLRFNLRLADPIEHHLDADAPWHGISGDYVVTLGKNSSAVPGTDALIPTLCASVNAFSRLWMGVRPTSGLAITDDITGPPELIQALDKAFLLPTPHMGWDI